MPLQRGNVSHENLNVVNAILFVAENGCKWRALPKALYRRRNEVEHLFRSLKGFRRIFSRFDKLDLMFIAFMNFALIVEALRQQR